MRVRNVLICLLALLLVIPAMAEDVQLRGYVKGKGWQYVYFGEYPYERDGTPAPVLWRILSIEDDKALLLTEHVIDTQQVIFETNAWKIENRDYRRITRYDESDLYTWLNTEALETLMGNDPLRKALIDEPGRGKLFVLDKMEFLSPAFGFSATQWDNQPSRHATGTPYAIKTRGLYVESGKSPYWTSTVRDPVGHQLALVGYNGHLSWGAYTRVNVGLRLSVRLDLSQVTVASGAGTKAAPFVFTCTGDLTQPTATPASTAAPVPTATPEPVAAPTAAPAERAEGEIVLSLLGNCAIGDTSRNIGSASSYHRAVDQHGYAWPFELVKEYLTTDDLTVANLEQVFTQRKDRAENTDGYVGAPDHVQALVEGGIDMVNTVNNNCMTYFREGYVDTLDTLDAAGVARFGTVYPWQDYGFEDMAVAEVGGIRIGFTGFSKPQDYDQKRIATHIRSLKEEQGCDIVVVSVHWGDNVAAPSASQIVYAKAIINAGADVVWGHHPHLLQSMHFYQGKPIIYSAGNFAFGTAERENPETGIFQLAYERVDGKVQLKRLQVIPCNSQRSDEYRPQVVTEPEARQAVFAQLMMEKSYAKCENLPESFLENGVVCFENGKMLP